MFVLVVSLFRFAFVTSTLLGLVVVLLLIAIESSIVLVPSLFVPVRLVWLTVCLNRLLLTVIVISTPMLAMSSGIVVCASVDVVVSLIIVVMLLLVVVLLLTVVVPLVVVVSLVVVMSSTIAVSWTIVVMSIVVVIVS